MQHLRILLIVITMVASFASATSSQNRLNEEATNDLEFKPKPLMYEMAALEKYTLKNNELNREKIYSVANKLGMVMGRLDLTYSPREFSQIIIKGVDNTDVNRGLVLPIMRIMDRAYANDERSVGNLLNPLISELNPRMGQLLNKRLGLIEQQPRGELSPHDATSSNKPPTHGTDIISTRPTNIFGIGKGAEEAFALAMRLEKGLDNLFNKGTNGSIVINGGPFLEMRNRKVSKNEQFGMSMGCIEDIVFKTTKEAATDAFLGHRAGTTIGGPTGGLIGGVIGGILGTKEGIKQGLDSEECKKDKKNNSEPKDNNSKPTTPETPKETEKPEPNPTKDDPKDDPEHAPTDSTVRPSEEGVNRPKSAEEIHRQKQIDEAKKRAERAKYINTPPDYETYTPTEKLSYQEEQKRRLDPLVYRDQNSGGSSRESVISNEEILRRRLIPLIYPINERN